MKTNPAQAWDAIALLSRQADLADGLSPKAVQFVQGLLYDGRKRPQEGVLLRIARKLLCWHLAQKYSREERLRWFQQIENTGRAVFEQTGNQETFARVLAGLRETVDDYLPRQRFADSEEVPRLPQPVVELKWLDVQAWQALVVVPLSQLVLQSHPEQMTSLSNGLVEAVKTRSRTTGPLSDLLTAGNWELAFRTLTTIDRDDSPRHLEEARRLLVQGLASLPLSRREMVFGELIDIADEARWIKSSRWSRANAAYSLDEVDRMFEGLSGEIEAIRRGPARLPHPGADTNPSPQAPFPADSTAAPVRTADDQLEGAPEPSEAPVQPLFAPLQVVDVAALQTIGWQQCLDSAQGMFIDDAQSSHERLLRSPLLFEEYRVGEVVVVPPALLRQLAQEPVVHRRPSLRPAGPRECLAFHQGEKPYRGG